MLLPLTSDVPTRTDQDAHPASGSPAISDFVLGFPQKAPRTHTESNSRLGAKHILRCLGWTWRICLEPFLGIICPTTSTLSLPPRGDPGPQPAMVKVPVHPCCESPSRTLAGPAGWVQTLSRTRHHFRHGSHPTLHRAGLRPSFLHFASLAPAPGVSLPP